MSHPPAHLVTLHCIERTGAHAMTRDAIDAQLALLPGWTGDEKRIARTYSFDDYWATIAFVNAIAYVVHRENHHPELVVGYDRVEARFDTHTAGGVTGNDFICAAKCDAVYASRPRR